MAFFFLLDIISLNLLIFFDTMELLSPFTSYMEMGEGESILVCKPFQSFGLKENLHSSTLVLGLSKYFNHKGATEGRLVW